MVAIIKHAHLCLLITDEDIYDSQARCLRQKRFDKAAAGSLSTKFLPRELLFLYREI